MLGHRTLVLDDYLTILKRRWPLVVVPVLLFPLIALGITFLITPQYLSQTLVLIEGQKVPDNYVKPVISSDLDSRLASMRERILSRSSLQPIIDRYNLYANKGMTMDDRIDMARKNVEIRPITSEIAHTGGLPGFFISFKAGDAHTAQLVCGEITSLFLGENLRSREASAEGTTEFLKSQLTDAKRSLDEQDAKLAAFQKQYVGRLPGEEAPNVNMLTSLNTQLQAVTEQLARMEQDKSYEQAMLAQQAPAVSTVGGREVPISSEKQQAQQAQLQQLLTLEADLTTHYTDDHPDVVAVRRKISDLRHEMARTPAPSAGGASSTPTAADSPAVQQLRAQLRSADIGVQAKRREQAQLQSAISMYQSRISATPMVEQEYKQLTRGYQEAQAFYDDISNKMNQSKMATDLEKRQQGEQFRIMDEPNLPDAPFSPKRPVYVIGGFAIGLGLGLALIAFLEYRDTTVKSERDIWAFTKLPTLAVIAFDTDIPEAPKGRGLARWFSRKRSKDALAQAAG